MDLGTRTEELKSLKLALPTFALQLDGFEARLIRSHLYRMRQGCPVNSIEIAGKNRSAVRLATVWTTQGQGA